MSDLFPTGLDDLRNDRRYEAKVQDRLALIIDRIGYEFNRLMPSKLYSTPFRFQEEDSKATSHYILHLTKHPRGYDLIKQVYSEFDNLGASLDGNGCYTFDVKLLDVPATGFEFEDENEAILKEKLLADFKGKCISVQELFDQHQVKTPFTVRHYVRALRALHSEDKISAEHRDDGNHRFAVLYNSTCFITFP